MVAVETVLVALDLAFPPPMRKIEQASVVVLDRKGAWLGATPAELGRWRLRADLAHIDPEFVRRLKALEDARFDLHPGVDPMALTRAALGDFAAGRVRSGGSTLSMQLARRLEPRPRKLVAKFIEAVRAIQLEARLGKDGVLADYLTLAPYGGDLEGVRTASLAYFGHEPDRLSDGEQALLIALPQAPEARRPDRRPAAAWTARHHILIRLQAAHLISPAARALADAEPLPRRHPLPAPAWQVARGVAKIASAPEGVITSTIDAGLQSDLAALTARTAAAQGPSSSAAVVVVDLRTRAVRALVGSVGCDHPGGWIDLTRSLRSPGSALKPFIYAMAFEDGLAAPGSKIRDGSVSYAGYRPRDFDRAFRGEVTVAEALRDSLNAPAVRMLSGIGPSILEQRLRAVGVVFQRPRTGLTGPSLALALGGEGVRLRDLAMLYAALGDGGIAKPLAWTQSQAEANLRQPGTRLIRAEAADHVLDILRQGQPPDGRAAIQPLEDVDRIAFKTGTSYAFRDAVAAGVGSGYAVAVWTGRPDGGGRPGLTGREAALPLLFEIFDRLHAGSADRGANNPAIGTPPSGLMQVNNVAEIAPQVLFPPDGAVLHLDGAGAKSPGFVLSGQGQNLRWYIAGRPIETDSLTGQAVWRPAGPGFYRIETVDPDGRRSASQVRVVN